MTVCWERLICRKSIAQVNKFYTQNWIEIELKVLLLATIIATSTASSSRSETIVYAPGDYDAAWVYVDDQAKNGCWTNIGEAKVYAEDQMELAGFNVIEEPEVDSSDDLNPILEKNGIALDVRVIAQRLNDGLCVGYIHTAFYGSMKNPNRDEFTLIGIVGRNTTWSVWSTKNLNNYVLDHIKGFIPIWVEYGVRDVD